MIARSSFFSQVDVKLLRSHSKLFNFFHTFSNLFTPFLQPLAICLIYRRRYLAMDPQQEQQQEEEEEAPPIEGGAKKKPEGGVAWKDSKAKALLRADIISG